MHIVQKNLDICTLDKYYNIMYINKIGKDIFKEEELVLRYRLLLNIHNIIKEFEQYKKLLKESVKFFLYANWDDIAQILKFENILRGNESAVDLLEELFSCGAINSFEYEEQLKKYLLYK